MNAEFDGCVDRYFVAPCKVCDYKIKHLFYCHICKQNKDITKFNHRTQSDFDHHYREKNIEQSYGTYELRYAYKDIYFSVSKYCEDCEYIAFPGSRSTKRFCWFCHKSLGKYAHINHIGTKKHLQNKTDWELNGFKRLE